MTVAADSDQNPPIATPTKARPAISTEMNRLVSTANTPDTAMVCPA
jgi:hypothetical protein